MATIEIHEDHLRITFTAFERFAGLVRSRDIPLDAIDDVAVESSGFDAVRGWRSPGMALPGRSKIGTWRGGGRRTLVRVRRGQPAVRIDAHGQQFDRFIIGGDDAATTVERIATRLAGRRAAGPR